MVHNFLNGTLTAVAGSAAININGYLHTLSHLFIKSASNDTTFEVSLTDKFNNVTYKREDLGEINDMPHLPGYGIWTLNITNASNDEEFTYLIVLTKTT